MQAEWHSESYIQPIFNSGSTVYVGPPRFSHRNMGSEFRVKTAGCCFSVSSRISEQFDRKPASPLQTEGNTVFMKKNHRGNEGNTTNRCWRQTTFSPVECWCGVTEPVHRKKLKALCGHRQVGQSVDVISGPQEHLIGSCQESIGISKA